MARQGATPRNLRNPPIREAILDVRVVTQATVSPEALKTAPAALQAKYPLVEEFNAFETIFGLGPDLAPPQQRSLGVTGYWFRSQDQKTTVQFRTDGFTYNRLAPYTGWDSILPAALDAWCAYAEITRPAAAIRVAVRYINQILGPAEGEEFEDFLTTPPAVPAGAPQGIGAFLSRVELGEADGATRVALMLATDQPTEQGQARIVVDIDAFVTGDIGTTRQDLESVWNRLRHLKNRVFFSAITERVANHYDV